MSDAVTIELRYEPPLDWDFLLGFLQQRQSRGVEFIENGTYARTVHIDGDVGRMSVRHEPEQTRLVLHISGAVTKHAPEMARRVRRLFDLDMDQAAVADVLGRDPFIGPLRAAHPGIRVPGAWSPFEMLARTIVGQQVSVSAATTIMGRIVERTGNPVPGPSSRAMAEPDSPVTMLFPEPEAIAAANLDAIGMPGRRVEALQTVARYVAEGNLPLRGMSVSGDCSGDSSGDDVKAALLQLPGIGPWTAECFAMRALGDTDAWPETDLIIWRALERFAEAAPAPKKGAVVPRSKQALMRSLAERWRPFRAYATVHLWHAAAQVTEPRAKR